MIDAIKDQDEETVKRLTKDQDRQFAYPERDLAQMQTIPGPARSDPEAFPPVATQTSDSGLRDGPETAPVADLVAEPLLRKTPAVDATVALQVRLDAVQRRVLAMTSEINQINRTLDRHARDIGQSLAVPVPSELPTRAEIIRARLMDLTNPGFIVAVVAAIISFAATLPSHGVSPNIAYIVGGVFGIVYVAAKYYASSQGQSNVDKVLRVTRTDGG